MPTELAGFEAGGGTITAVELPDTPELVNCQFFGGCVSPAEIRTDKTEAQLRAVVWDYDYASSTPDSARHIENNDVSLLFGTGMPLKTVHVVCADGAFDVAADGQSAAHRYSHLISIHIIKENPIMSERNRNEQTNKKSNKLWVKIMAWVLSILMAGSVATLTITMLLDMLAH